MKIRRGRKIDFEDVLIVPRESKLNSRSEVNLNVEYLMVNSGRIWKGIPIIASNMDTIGTIEVYNEFKKYNMCCALHKFYDSETLVRFFNGLENNDNEYVFYTMGITENDIQKYNYVKNKTGSEKIVNVCIDVANGYMDKFLKFVDNFRKENKMVNLMAGNVVTPEACLKLIDVGVDIIKIGIGNGSVCTTRKITGVGYPQLSSLIECSAAVHEKNGFICCDGGIKDPGDFGKAFGAGSDFVVAGGIFSGHDENIGNDKSKIIVKRFLTNELDENGNPKIEEKKYLQFYGMSSDTAMNKYYGSVADYRASEGETILVPYKGRIENTIKEILGGLRSTCTYVGAKKLAELPNRVEFVKVNRILNGKFKFNP